MHKDLKKKEPYGSLLPTSFVAVEGCGQALINKYIIAYF